MEPVLKADSSFFMQAVAPWTASNKPQDVLEPAEKCTPYGLDHFCDLHNGAGFESRFQFFDANRVPINILE